MFFIYKMAGKGSLRVISKSLNFEESTANIGIGGSFAPNVKLTIINNPNSWKNTIFKNSQNSDYISIGTYDSNNYIASIDKNIDLFKDLYINNIGISSQPSSLIGNVIINGKTTIGNNSNDIITNNYIVDIYSKTSNNLLILRNSNSFLDFSINNNNFNINTSSSNIFINSSIIIGSNDSNSLNPKLFIAGNTIIENNLIIGSNNSNLNNLNKNNYYSILINSNMYINCNLIVNGLISGSIKTSSIILDEAKKINANLININSNSPLLITSNNQLSFNINSNSPLLITSNNQLSFNINSNSPLFITSNNQLSFNINSNSPLLITSNNQLSFNINSNSPLLITSNNQLSFNINSNSPLFITSNNQLSFKINSNSSLFINSNNELSSINQTTYNINSNSPLFIDSNNQLSFNINPEIFYITSNYELSILDTINIGNGNGGNTESYWKSANPSISPTDVIYFNYGKSYVSINNDDPRSYLYVGPNGNLLRLATINDINDSYYSQISTNDNINNSNNTKIKLIAPVSQQLLNQTSDISGSIYYNITGNNPIHSFNYESNGIITPQLLINKSGTIIINSSNNYQTSNNEKLIVNGSINIIDENSKFIIGSNIITNNYTSLNGTLDVISKLIIGSNIFTNNSININKGNVNINSNLFINGSIYASGSNISNLKVSELYLDDINKKINANFINIDSNTGININNSNQLYLKFDYSKFEFTSNNEISLINSDIPSFWNSAIPFITDPTTVSKIYFNKSDSFVGINNDDPRSYLYVGPNGNLLRLATINNINESYYSQISTNDNVNNSNNTKIKLIAPVEQSLLVSSNNDISGSIYYNITGNNPIHSFNYDSNGNIKSLMNINKSGIIIINSSNNYQTSNNEKLIVNGSINIIDENSKFIIGSNIISSNQIIFNSKTLIGTSNIESSLYSLYVNQGNVKINSNLFIGSKTLIGTSNSESSLYSLYINEGNVKINSNLFINGSIYANGSNISNLKVSQLYLDDINKKINANFINIDSNTGININNSNQLYLKFDYSKFQITSNNEISLTNSAVPSFWKSAIPFITDPTTVSKIYFNYNDSFVGINNDDPRSYLYVGPNGNLLRLATINNINESYYSQISTNDNVNNNNNTKIKLIAPVEQSLLISSNNDISGSIYYNITGNNPIHSFNYDSNGNIKSLMNINKSGTIFINSSNNISSNNEKLIVNGNVSILNSPKVIIGDSNYNNGTFQTYGNIIIGNSNIDTNQYSLYVNSNVKINNDLVINNNITGSNVVNFTKYVSIGSYIQQIDSNYVLNVNGNMALNGIINTTSDIRLKNNIKTCENSLDKILKCRGVSFNYNKDENKNIGVIAQELEEIFPELVNTNNEGYKNVNYIGIIGVLIEAIKDLNNKIENKVY